MFDDFIGVDEIVLHPLSNNITYTLSFTTNSKGYANDGALPFEAEITSESSLAYTLTGDPVDTLIKFTNIVSPDKLNIVLSYPGSIYDNTMLVLKILLTINSSTTLLPFYFPRVKIVNEGFV